MRRSDQAIVSSKLRITVRVAVVLLAGASLSGCVLGHAVAGLAAEFDRDLSDNEQRWATSGFVRGGVYETQYDLFLMNMKGYSNGPGLAFGRGEKHGASGRANWGGPTTAALYKKNPELWPKVTGIVDAGTRIKIVQLREVGNSYAKAPTYPYVKGEILTGPFAGIVVDLLEVCSYKPRSREEPPALLGPNPRALALATDNQK